MKKFILVLFAVMVSFSTVLEARAFGRKYTQTKIAEDSYIIVQKGNAPTIERTMLGLLTRASEVAIAEGYAYFVVLSTESIGLMSHRLFPKSEQVIKIKCFKDKPHRAVDMVDAYLFLEERGMTPPIPQGKEEKRAKIEIIV
mgnify:CR=1 FL=1